MTMATTTTTISDTTTSTDGPRLCQSREDPLPAVVGPHTHFNGGFDAVCPYGETCETPSCHPAALDDYEDTLADVRHELDEAYHRLHSFEHPSCLVARPHYHCVGPCPEAPERAGPHLHESQPPWGVIAYEEAGVSTVAV